MNRFLKYSGIIGTSLFSIFNIFWLIFSDVINIENEFSKISCIVVLITIGIIIIIAMIYNITYNSSKKHRLPINTEKFHDFFKKWYSKSGQLHIVCDDLNWINEDVLNVLKFKSQSSELFLHLEDPDKDNNAMILKSLGAKTSKVPNYIIDNYSFSYVNYMGNSFNIIIRDKRRDNNNYIYFDEMKTESLQFNLIKSIVERNEAHDANK